jgi:hypothetical protein
LSERSAKNPRASNATSRTTSTLGFDSAVVAATAVRVGSGRAVSSTDGAIEFSDRVLPADALRAACAADDAVLSGDGCAPVSVAASGAAGMVSATAAVGLAFPAGGATRDAISGASGLAGARGITTSVGRDASSTAAVPFDGVRRFATYARGSARPSLDVALGMLEAACRTGIETGVRRLT